MIHEDIPLFLWCKVVLIYTFQEVSALSILYVTSVCEVKIYRKYFCKFKVNTLQVSVANKPLLSNLLC